MTPALAVGIVSLIAVMGLIALRVPIGVSLGIVGLVGFTWLRGFHVALSNVAQVPFETAANWGLSAIPMFILMVGEDRLL